MGGNARTALPGRAADPEPASCLRVQGVDAEHHRLLIDDEMLLEVLQCGLDDPREAPSPVVSVAREQPHGRALLLDAQAITVILISWIQSGPTGTAFATAGRQNSIGRARHFGVFRDRDVLS
jgi:hypothetical protein